MPPAVLSGFCNKLNHPFGPPFPVFSDFKPARLCFQEFLFRQSRKFSLAQIILNHAVVLFGKLSQKALVSRKPYVQILKAW